MDRNLELYLAKNGSMILWYLKWLQNVLQYSHRNDWCFSCFRFHLPPNPILKVVVLVALPLFPCFVPFTPEGCSEFAFTHFPITIESVSLFQSPSIWTKRSNSFLAVHVLLTQQHAFRFYLHLPKIEEINDAYFCEIMCQLKIEYESIDQ